MVSNQGTKRNLKTKKGLRAVENDNEKNCPECGAQNRENSKFCTRCGVELPREYEELVDEGEPLTSRLCPDCGTENPGYALFCMECGNSLKHLKGYNKDPSILKRDSRGEIEEFEMQSLNLTPAESLLILDPLVNGKKMFKLTFIDLLVRGVIDLDTKKVERGIIFKKMVSIPLVLRGRAFNTPHLKPHEKIFRNVFFKNQILELQEYSRRLLKQISRDKGKDYFSGYRDNYVRSPLVEAGYFGKVKKKTAVMFSRESYELTEYGADVKSKIKKLLDDSINLDYWMEKDKKRAKALLSACGTHILLEGYDIKTIREFSRILHRVELKKGLYYNYYLYSLPFGYLGTDIVNFDWFKPDIGVNFTDLDLDYFVDVFDADIDSGAGDSGDGVLGVDFGSEGDSG